MKISKTIRFFILLLLISRIFPLEGSAATVQDVRSYYSPGDNIKIQYDLNNDDGTLFVCITGTQKDVSLLVSKEKESYVYRISPDEVESIPLNMGNGNYELAFRLYITPKEGELIWTDIVNVALVNSLSPFLKSSKIIKWSEDMELVKKAGSITDGMNKKEAALKICEYISQSYTYNNTSPPPGYIPDLNSILGKDTGFCYDFAALYTAMCRSIGIPSQLIMGYTDYLGDTYHAWCLVYINGTWHMIDPTYSIQYGAAFLDEAKTTISKLY